MAIPPSTIDLNDLTVQITSEEHPEHRTAFEIISLKVNHPQYGDIVSLKAWRIFRRNFAPQFLPIMFEGELHEFAVTLFDKYGYVRPYLVDPGHRRGTGCWGREMNTGHLMYILDIRVKKSHRGQGVGTWTLLQLLGSEHVRPDDTVICCPTPARIDDVNIWNAVRNKQIAFFRKNQFRRIGRTHFFGYSPKPDHPSRNIPLDADIGALEDNFPQPATDDIQTQFPLLFAIANDSSANIAATIQSLYNKDPASIHQADNKGFTPIFIAASTMNVPAVRKLLEWDLRADLENAENVQGATPLEGLADIMQATREFAEIFLQWTGYSDEELTIQSLLKRAMGQMVNDDILSAKYGCTCNQCAGGWLSPRMRIRLCRESCVVMNYIESDGALADETGFWADSMPMNFESFKKGQPATTKQIMTMDFPSGFIPPALYPNLYLSFYRGYSNILEGIRLFLDASEGALSAERVLPFIKMDSHSKFYFAKGGRIEYAFDAITRATQDASPLADDTFSELYRDDEDWVTLPTCANDLEFKLVRAMLGLDIPLGMPGGQEWGPYDVFEDDDDGLDTIMEQLRAKFAAMGAGRE
ncbi:ankyrin repeat family protein [Mycena galericulata]|nr:ankyrin repeat family protein [Mycena galericulata]